MSWFEAEMRDCSFQILDPNAQLLEFPAETPAPMAQLVQQRIWDRDHSKEFAATFFYLLMMITVNFSEPLLHGPNTRLVRSARPRGDSPADAGISSGQ